MQQPLVRSSKAVITVTRSLFFPPKLSFIFLHSYSSSSPEPPSKQQQQPRTSTFQIGSPTRVQKLISAQSDPLLAKEIFDFASNQPGFRHSYSSFLVLVLKLGRAKHFSLVDDLLVRLKSEKYPVTPTLFSDLMKIYAEANLLEKTLNTFYKMLEFNIKPSPMHSNRILELLISHLSFLTPALTF